jgi:hypothetical protein
MSIYDDFAAARVEHLFFGVNGSYLAAAHADMMADPDYDKNKHEKALQDSRRVLSMLRSLLTQQLRQLRKVRRDPPRLGDREEQRDDP